MSNDPQKQSGEEAEILQRLDKILRELLEEPTLPGEQPPAPIPEMPQTAAEMLANARAETPDLSTVEVPQPEGRPQLTEEEFDRINEELRSVFKPPEKVPPTPVEMPQTAAEMLQAARKSVQPTATPTTTAKTSAEPTTTTPTTARAETPQQTQVQLAPSTAKEIGEAVKDAVEPLIETAKERLERDAQRLEFYEREVERIIERGAAGATTVETRTAAATKPTSPQELYAATELGWKGRQAETETTLETILADIVQGSVGEEAGQAIAKTVDSDVHPLIEASRTALAADRSEQERYQARYDALVSGEQFGGEPLPRRTKEAFRRGEIQSPEELYAQEELGYRPSGDKPGRTFADVFTEEQRKTTSIQEEIKRHTETFERLQTGKSRTDEKDLADAYEKGRVQTPADVAMYQKREEVGVTDVQTEQEIKEEQKPPKPDKPPKPPKPTPAQQGGLADLLPWLPGGAQIAKALDVAKPAMFGYSPGLATALFGEAAAEEAGAIPKAGTDATSKTVIPEDIAQAAKDFATSTGGSGGAATGVGPASMLKEEIETMKKAASAVTPPPPESSIPDTPSPTSGGTGNWTQPQTGSQPQAGETGTQSAIPQSVGEAADAIADAIGSQQGPPSGGQGGPQLPTGAGGQATGSGGPATGGAAVPPIPGAVPSIPGTPTSTQQPIPWAATGTSGPGTPVPPSKGGPPESGPPDKDDLGGTLGTAGKAAGLAGMAGLASAATPIGAALMIAAGVKTAGDKLVQGAVEAASPAMDPASQQVATDMGQMAVSQMIGPLGIALNITQLPRKITEWAEALVESRERLKDWNSEIAGYFARAEYRQIRRDIASGERTSFATVGLGEDWQDLLDELQPIKDAVTVGLTEIVRLLTQGVTVLVEFGKTWPGVAQVLAAQEAARAAEEARGMQNVEAFMGQLLGGNQGTRRVVQDSGEQLHGRGTHMPSPRVAVRP